jgi:hypothetical protein
MRGARRGQAAQVARAGAVRCWRAGRAGARLMQAREPGVQAGTSAVRVEQHAAAGAELEQAREPARMRALERRNAGAGVEPGTRRRWSVDAR